MNGGERTPLRIEYRHVQALSARGNHRIRLDEDGALFVDIVAGDCPRGTHWSGPWPSVPLRRLSAAELDLLVRTVAQSGFFELPAEVLRPGRDGYRDEIDVVLGVRAHGVAVERAPPPPAFEHLRRMLLQFAGPPLAA